MSSLVFSLCLVAAAASCAPKEGEQEVPIEAATSLAVSNDRGSVSIIGGSVPDFIFLTYSIYSDDGDATVSDVSMVAGPSGDEFVVSVSTPGPDVWVDLVLGMPDSMRWSVTTGSGDVFLESLSGGGEVQTASGVVSGGDVSGGVAVVADISEVHFDLRIEEGDQVSIQLGGGSIVLDLPTPTHAGLQASTDDGTLVLWDLSFDGDQDDRAANGTLGNGGTAAISLYTVQGDISLIGAGEASR
jgi:hypothetical protein